MDRLPPLLGKCSAGRRLNVSEVIENFIRRHPQLSESEAFDGFLSEDRIKSWVGTDQSRRERLRKEFGRVWAEHHVEQVRAQTPTSARAGPSGPARTSPSQAIRVEVTPSAQGPPVAPPSAPGPAQASRASATNGGGRKLQVLCTKCRRVDVWMAANNTVQCRACGLQYDDMLQLIRVTPVGPFEFIFGQGWRGIAMGAGIVAGLVGLYLILRWA